MTSGHVSRRFSRSRPDRLADSASIADEGDGIISHITPADGNVFLDLGFSPDEAARLKAESDRRIRQADQLQPNDTHGQTKR